MTRAILAALWSHWRRAPLQLATLVVGIALATGLWSGVQAINAEARAGFAAAEDGLRLGALARLVRPQGPALTMADFVALRRAGVLVSPMLRGPATVEGQAVDLIGLDPLTAPAGLWPQAGGIGPGIDPATVILGAAGPSRAGTLRSPDLPPGTAIADLGRAAELLGHETLDALLLIAPQPLGAPDPGSVLPGLQRIAPAAGTDPAALTESFRLNLSAFGALCFVVGLFIVRGTIGLAMAQRRRLLAVLRALGAPLALVGALMVAELALIALAAGAVGVALGYLVAVALMPGVSATLAGVYGAEVGSGVALRPAWWLGGIALAIAGTLVSAAGPLIAAARRPVLAAAAPARGWPWALGGAGLLAAAAGLLALGGGLVPTFAAIGALLLGAAALMPGLVRAMLHALPAGAAPLRAWAVAETRDQVPQMALAMTALLMALAANIGVGTMVDSFRTAFGGFLDQRLAAELYVAAPDGGTALRAALPAGVRALPIEHVAARVAGQPVEIHGVVDDTTYRRDWRLLAGAPGAWDAVQAGRGAVINEQLAHRAGIAPGAAIALPDGPAEVVGIVADYGNPLGQVIVSDSRYRALPDARPPERFALRTPDPAGTARALAAAGVPAEAVQTRAQVRNLSLRIFERTFAVTGALNALTLAVAGFAVLTALLTIADQRVRRLAPLWAMGVPRRALAALELGRVVLLAVLTALLALPVGLALGWILLARVNVAAFGWRLPFQPDLAAWAGLMALGIAAAGLAALWPAWRLARSSPRALIEVFSGDG
ncbi:FtsX-like permease family protein [Paracoccus contaminans]|uniref:ABC transporter permease n=1 Tax=Paracoccus contaminans TaxID=1945662 RepID=A0A1W6CW73_9RHOB|nr:FtsX-like permease family protein [Paracoccus contaminans]ARJ69101.1 hypothetical protein B0A89_05145 [Paracoccus contaminans]